MWKEDILKDIEKTRFNPHELFNNPNTNEFVTRDQYINLILDDFLKKQKEIIISLGGLIELETLETNLGVLTVLNPLKCNEELAKSLLTYVYWKYKNPKSELTKVDITNVKTVVGLENIFIEELIEPISFKAKCHICNGDSIISIPSYEHNRIKFKCNECDHFYQTASGSNSKANKYKGTAYAKCNCNLCKNIKKRFYDKGNMWFNTLKNICSDFIETSDEIINTPNELTMKRHYDIYLNNQTDKSIKEILTYNTKSLDELLEIVENISNIQNNCYEYYKSLIKKLKNHNIIYTSLKKRNINLETFILAYIFGGIDRVSDVSFDEFSNYIISGKFIDSYYINEHRHHSDFTFLDYGFSSRSCLNFNIVDKIDIKNIEKYLYEEYLIMNPYFINGDNTREDIIKEINHIIDNCSELDLKLILETSKAITSINK